MANNNDITNKGDDCLVAIHPVLSEKNKRHESGRMVQSSGAEVPFINLNNLIPEILVDIITPTIFCVLLCVSKDTNTQMSSAIIIDEIFDSVLRIQCKYHISAFQENMTRVAMKELIPVLVPCLDLSEFSPCLMNPRSEIGYSKNYLQKLLLLDLKFPNEFAVFFKRLKIYKHNEWTLFHHDREYSIIIYTNLNIKRDITHKYSGISRFECMGTIKSYPEENNFVQTICQLCKWNILGASEIVDAFEHALNFAPNSVLFQDFYDCVSSNQPLEEINDIIRIGFDITKIPFPALKRWNPFFINLVTHESLCMQIICTQTARMSSEVEHKFIKYIIRSKSVNMILCFGRKFGIKSTVIKSEINKFLKSGTQHEGIINYLTTEFPKELVC